VRPKGRLLAVQACRTQNTGILPVFAWAFAAAAKVRPKGRLLAVQACRTQNTGILPP
jgi:hypothetical protein